MVTSGPMLPLGPCLGLWSYSSNGLLPPKARHMSLVWAVDYGHVDICDLHRTGSATHMDIVGVLDLRR